MPTDNTAPAEMDKNDRAAVEAVRNASAHEGLYLSRPVALRLLRLIDAAYPKPEK